MAFAATRSRAGGLSNGAVTGPRIGLQKGPRVVVGLEGIGCGAAEP